jgi:hypothetical protein
VINIRLTGSYSCGYLDTGFFSSLFCCHVTTKGICYYHHCFKKKKKKKKILILILNLIVGFCDHFTMDFNTPKFVLVEFRMGKLLGFKAY